MSNKTKKFVCEEVEAEKESNPKVVLEDTEGHKVYLKDEQVARLTMMRQMSWYLISLVIYIGCALFGFGIAYLVIKILIYYNIQ